MLIVLLYTDVLQWAAAIENLNIGSSSPGSDRSFGMKQRPDGDVEIDEKFWEENFHIPTCQQCSGVLKPDVRCYIGSVFIAVMFLCFSVPSLIMVTGFYFCFQYECSSNTSVLFSSY